jgi:S1-C subfamily serine protease
MDEQRWSRRQLLAAFGTVAAGSVAGCSLGAPGQPATETPAPTPSTPENPPTPDAPPEFEALDIEPQEGGTDQPPAESTFTEVYRSVVDSVAAVRVQALSGTASGTAWVYDENHIVTNNHVVENGNSISIWFGDTGWRSARVVGTDIYSDLAVLRAPDLPAEATPLSLVDREPAIGTEVMAIGNPFGLAGSVSTGVISGRNRSIPGPQGFSIPDAVQTDAPLNPGNSGGPIVTLDGDVVAVANSGGGDNIGFGISAAMVKRVIPALLADGEYRHSYMGVELRDVVPPVVEANGFPISWGIYINDTVDDGPAEGVLQGSTGVRTVGNQRVGVGGDLLFRMDGTDIPNQQALSTFLALETSPGDTVDVEVLRDGSRQTVQLTLGARPEPA